MVRNSQLRIHKKLGRFYKGTIYYCIVDKIEENLLFDGEEITTILIGSGKHRLDIKAKSITTLGIKMQLLKKKIKVNDGESINLILRGNPVGGVNLEEVQRAKFELSESIDRSNFGVFISYRRQDSADVSGRIYDRLAAEFDKKYIFKDVDDIPFGSDYRKYIADVISNCHFVLVVIGPNWASLQDAQGQPRLFAPHDLVRIEVETAFIKNIPIIPILVRGASMPKKKILPASIKKITHLNAILVRPDPDFHKDMSRLIADMRKGLGIFS
jgi:hypothetical protein